MLEPLGWPEACAGRFQADSIENGNGFIPRGCWLLNGVQSHGMQVVFETQETG